MLRVLEHESDLAVQRATVVLSGVYVLAVEQYLSLGWLYQPGNELCERGLAGACRTHDADKLTVRRVKRHAAQSAHGKRRAGIVCIRNILQLYRHTSSTNSSSVSGHISSFTPASSRS